MTAGLTGQTGAGKTLISEEFERCGFKVLNCDILARRVLEPQTECFFKIKELFPQFFENDKFNRKKAAELLFNDRELLKRYNAAIFPYINALIEGEIERLEKSGAEFILLDAPTLFEAGADKLCDVTIAAAADESIRIERIIRRDGISERAARDRAKNQHSEEFFRAHADIVIENNGEAGQALERARKAAEIIKTNKKEKRRSDDKKDKKE